MTVMFLSMYLFAQYNDCISLDILYVFLKIILECVTVTPIGNALLIKSIVVKIIFSTALC